MSKIHVLPDEKLNGVLREYIEVERKANAGEKIIGKNTGNIYTVLCAFSNSIETDSGKHIHHQDYFVLEPTDIVHIDGARYRLVNRKAKVGEKVIVFNHSNENGNGVFTVYDVYIVNDGARYVGKDMRYYSASSKDYRVLDPVEPTEIVTAEEGDDKSVLDLLANLAQRVTELERQQKENRELIIKAFESIYGKDNVFTVDERVTMLEREVSEMYKRLRKSEEKIETALDDIITLDERTQPLLALIKAVKDDG